jgi:hypothetical protein
MQRLNYKVPRAIRETLKERKRIFDHVFFVYFDSYFDFVLLSILIYFLFIASYVLKLTNWFINQQASLYEKEFEDAHKNPNFKLNSVLDAWVSVVAAFFLFIFEKMFTYLTWDWCDYYNKEKDPVPKRLSTARMCLKSYNTIYFGMTTWYGWCVLYKTDFLPTMLGGKNDNELSNIWKNYPVTNEDYAEELKLYACITLGYHLESLFKLIELNQKEKRRDFVDMLLHHLLTVLLYINCYRTNTLKIGCILMFLHDWADIPTSLIKLVRQTNFKITTYIVCGINVVVWGYSRIYVFPQVIYYSFIVGPEQQIYPNWREPGDIDWQRKSFELVKFPAIVFMSMLLFLHVYWYYLFLGMIIEALCKGADKVDTGKLMGDQVISEKKTENQNETEAG